MCPIRCACQINCVVWDERQSCLRTTSQRYPLTNCTAEFSKACESAWKTQDAKPNQANETEARIADKANLKFYDKAAEDINNEWNFGSGLDGFHSTAAH